MWKYATLVLIRERECLKPSGNEKEDSISLHGRLLPRSDLTLLNRSAWKSDVGIVPYIVVIFLKIGIEINFGRGRRKGGDGVIRVENGRKYRVLTLISGGEK